MEIPGSPSFAEIFRLARRSNVKNFHCLFEVLLELLVTKTGLFLMTN